MYFIYNVLISLFGMLLSPLVLVLFVLKPKLRAGFLTKIGFYSKLNEEKPNIWIHAVSVGEVNAVESLVKKLNQTYPDHNLVITTVTRTGQQVAANKFSKFATITYFPYDFFFSVNSAIKAIKPKLVIIAETEIWPTFLHKLNKNNIPVILVNGRISPGSYRNYKKFRYFFKKILNNFSLILMQTEEDKKRIVDIGARAEKVEVMGNLKFDISNVLEKEEINQLRKSFELGNKRLIIAGSTHSGEDEIILNVFQNLKKDFPDIKLLMAPRHPERNEQVIKLIAASGFKFGLRSKHSNFKDTDIILLDTMGELSKLYSVSYLAFIGGSLSNTGGHNPLESAIYGVPVISGSTVFNFKDIYKYMEDTKAAFIVKEKQELYQNFFILLSDSEKYEQASNACKSIFESNKGALEFSLEKINKFI